MSHEGALPYPVGRGISFHVPIIIMLPRRVLQYFIDCRRNSIFERPAPINPSVRITSVPHIVSTKTMFSGPESRYKERNKH